MRVAVLTTPEGLFTVHHLVRSLDVAGIVVDRGPIGGAGPRRTLGEKIAYFRARGGLPAVARAAAAKLAPALVERDPFARARRLEAAYRRELDRIFFGYPHYARRLEARDFVSWDELRDHHHVPVVEVDNVNGPAALEALAGWAVDLAIIAGGRILKPPILALPRAGVLNKHSSLLPRHRGLAAEYWCLYHEELDALGVTVHFVAPGLDDGPIVLQRPMAFERGDTPETLRHKSNLVGRELLVEAVRLIEATGTRGTPQDEGRASRNKRPTPESDRELRAKLPRLWERYGA